jgi:chromosome condensin MukBEF ATPase and DNA-binding subunit MukB
MAVRGYDGYKKAIAKSDYKGLVELKQTCPQSYEQYKADYQTEIEREREIKQNGYYMPDFLAQFEGGRQ